MQPFHPFYVDRIPYIVATVELDEEPGLMFMTQLVDCTEEDLRIGMPVEVTFVELAPRAHAAVLPPGVGHRRRCLMATGQRVAIVGCGYSHVGRNTGLSIDDHMIQATKAALADAGLTVHDIDGVTSVGTEPLNDAWLLGIEPGQLVGVGHDGAGVLVLGDAGDRRGRVGLLPHRARAPRDRPAAERVGAGEGRAAPTTR